MQSLRIGNKDDKLKVLCLGAHCDDIEIGCGGTILKLAAEYTLEHVKWVVFASNPVRAEEARKCAEYFLRDVPSKEIVVLAFQDSVLPQVWGDVKKYFEEIKRDFVPDVIFTHFRHDLHQDHRLLNELTWNTFRDHFVLEYEIPKYDGDLGTPNFFVALDEATANKKVDAILEYYVSQAGKQWWDKETFFALMRIRGMECATRTRYAEAFHARKVKL